MVAWFLIAVVQGAQTPLALELPAQAPCALSTALPLALANEALVVAQSPLTLKVQAGHDALTVSLVDHGAVRSTRELAFQAEDCAVLPQVIAALARAWVDAALQARVKAPQPERPVAPPQAPEPELAPEPESTPPVQAAPSAPQSPPKPEEPALKTLPSPEPPLAPEPSEELGPKRPIVSLEAGVDVFSRAFSYSMVGTMNLRSYSASTIFAPEGRVELYPLALWTRGTLAGLGIDGSFASAVGGTSRRSGTDSTWPTTLSHFDVNLRFRVTPLRALDAAVIPFVGYGSRRFEVGTGSDGTELDGLPQTLYSSLRIGVAGELPVLSSGFLFFGRFAALVVLSSGQIISPAFFPQGTNFGLEGQLGIGYRIVGPLELRLALDWTRYGLTFQPKPTDTFVAAGAVDVYLGGNFGVRLVF